MTPNKLPLPIKHRCKIQLILAPAQLYVNEFTLGRVSSAYRAGAIWFDIKHR